MIYKKNFSIGLNIICSIIIMLFCYTQSIAEPNNIPKSTDGKRLALIIGNSHYETVNISNVTGIESAKMVAESVEKVGFNSIRSYDLDKTQFKNILAKFKTHFVQGMTVFFYYAGHGIQVNGENYLIPVDYVLKEPVDISTQAVPMTKIFKMLKDERIARSIVVLDACRNNPWHEKYKNEKNWSGWIAGLAKPTNPPAESFISFSTNPYTKSADRESPFSKSLAENILKYGWDINTMFTKIKADLAEIDGMLFSSYFESHLSKSFYFREPVFIYGKINNCDDTAVVFLNGREILSCANSKTNAVPTKIRLQNDVNKFEIKVYNAHTFRGHNTVFGPPEGWKYSIDFITADGKLLKIEDGEDPPLRNGPHHGQRFTVASFNVKINADSGEVEFCDLDKNIWRRDNKNLGYIWKNNGCPECKYDEYAVTAEFIVPHGDFVYKDDPPCRNNPVAEIAQIIKAYGELKVPGIKHYGGPIHTITQTPTKLGKIINQHLRGSLGEFLSKKLYDPKAYCKPIFVTIPWDSEYTRYKLFVLSRDGQRWTMVNPGDNCDWSKFTLEPKLEWTENGGLLHTIFKNWSDNLNRKVRIRAYFKSSMNWDPNQ